MSCIIQVIVAQSILDHVSRVQERLMAYRMLNWHSVYES